MLKNSRTFLWCLVAVAMTSVTTQAAVTTLYEENFTLGFAGLSGYGWIADVTGGQTNNVKVAPGSWADQPGWGIQGDLAAGVEHWTHTFDTAIPADTTTVTATAKAYVRWGGDPGGWATKGDNGFGFRSDPGALDAGLSYDGSTAATGGWKLFVDGGDSVLLFDAHYEGTNVVNAALSGTPIEVTLDLINDTLTGTVFYVEGNGIWGDGPSTKTISTGGPGSAAILAGRVHYHTDLTRSGPLGGLDLDTILVTADVTANTGSPGDFDMDGDVDAADYTRWQDNLGLDSSVLSGNGSGAATVVQADYLLWKTNFEALGSGSGSATAVPEPTSGLLLAFGVVGLYTALRRKFSSLGRFRG